MTELAALFAGLGHMNVVTYIQSGNVVFSSPLEELGRHGQGAASRTASARELRSRRQGVAPDARRAHGPSSSRGTRSSGPAPILSKPPRDVSDDKPEAALVRDRMFRLPPRRVPWAGRDVYVHCPGIRQHEAQQRLRRKAVARDRHDP